MKMFRPYLILVICSLSACNGQKPAQDNTVLTVSDLISRPAKYASRILDVRGEIIMDYHGPTLCDESGTPCFFVILPENVFPRPDFDLEKDHTYEEYERLSIEIGSVQRTLGKAKLFATLRGRFDQYNLLPNGKEAIVQNPQKGSLVRCRFVLERVLNLDVRKLN
jgi:hypothetical protein